MRTSVKGPTGRQFPDEIIASVRRDKILRIRVGADTTHRIIGIRVVEGRVFVRSYQTKPGGWWHTFLKDPFDKIFVDGRKHGINIYAVQVKIDLSIHSYMIIL